MKKDDLFNLFQTQFTELAGNKAEITIALSGGLDSVVLLHLTSRLQSMTVVAHHVHHGLSENADHWALFCQQFASSLNVECMVSKVNIDKKNRISLEALAREKRYAILKNNLNKDSYLVTGHHQDDQLETVLLALKRGAGLTGLQGIVAKQALEKGYLIRPLLNFSREQLEAYAEQFSLQWIEDESNQDQHFDRNFIRHTITPLLKNRWPAIAKTVSRSASHCQTQQTLIDQITVADYLLCQKKPLVLNIDALKQLSETRRNNVVRYWFKEALLNYPSSKQLTAIWKNIALAKVDATPELLLQGKTISRYRGLLYLFKKCELTAESKKVVWQGEELLTLCSGSLRLKVEANKTFLDHHHLVEICFRKQLEEDFRCQPIGRGKSRSIKKLLHEYHVAPWLRDYVPFIFIDSVLVEAVGIWRCDQVFTESLRISII